MGLQDYQKVLSYSHLGVVFALTLGGFFYLGFKLDERLGTSPLFILLGGLLGFAAGFYHLYRSVYGEGGISGPPRQDGPNDDGRDQP